MASRMERYYPTDEKLKRSTKNALLYDEIYDDKKYDEVDNVKDINADTIATLDVGKQIDIREVQALLEKRSTYQNKRELVKEKLPETRENIYYETGNKSYDINDVLAEAKENTKEEERPRSLAETQVLTLQELINKKDYSNKNKLNENEVKDLIDTIYSTNLLSSDEGTGLLDELKSTGNTTVDSSIKDAIKGDTDEMTHIDKSFYTSSLGFKKSDFATLDEINEDNKKNNTGTIIFLIILAIIFVLAVSYIVYKYVL